MDAPLQELADTIAAAQGAAILDRQIAYGELTLTVDAAKIVEVAPTS